MLDHDEERRLAEIEARLRLDAPDLRELFEGPTEPVVVDAPRRRPLLRAVLAVLVAVALTAVVTLVVGPDLGGLVGVLALTAAGMYGYQAVRGCPGVRRRRGHGQSGG